MCFLYFDYEFMELIIIDLPLYTLIQHLFTHSKKCGDNCVKLTLSKTFTKVDCFDENNDFNRNIDNSIAIEPWELAI